MNLSAMPAGAARDGDAPQQADMVVGISSFHNARTIAHVVRATQAGLYKYYPQYKSVIVNSDGGSTDRTREEVLSVQ